MMSYRPRPEEARARCGPYNPASARTLGRPAPLRNAVFDKLSARLSAVVEGLRGRGRLTEDNIGDTLRQVRMALLEADVALPVVKDFIDAVRARAIGLEIHKSLTPGQALVRVIHEELVRVMGEGVRPINLRTQPPAIILLAGLQGAGKTTTAAKIALWLRERERKRVLLVDTAGRLHVDEEMMGEVRELGGALNPIETLFVVDSMAAGRRTSVETSSTRFFSRVLSHSASLAAVVVLPAPCRPASSTTAGGCTRRLSGRTPSPMTRTSSSWMILIRAWPGVRLL